MKKSVTKSGGQDQILERLKKREISSKGMDKLRKGISGILKNPEGVKLRII